MGGKGARIDGGGRELCQICVLLMPGSKPGFCFSVGKVCVQVARPYFFYQNFALSPIQNFEIRIFIPVEISLSPKSE